MNYRDPLCPKFPSNPLASSFLAYSRSLALQSADLLLEVGRRCVGAWGSPFLWCSLQASCSLRHSSFFSSSSFGFVFPWAFLFSPVPLSLISYGPLPPRTCSTQHSMHRPTFCIFIASFVMLFMILLFLHSFAAFSIILRDYWTCSLFMENIDDVSPTGWGDLAPLS